MSMTQSGIACTEAEAVGRVGTLELTYVRQDGRTVLSHSHSRSPWHFVPPISLDETSCLYTLLVNPSGGLVGGDRLSVRAALDEGTHVLFSTPSANRVYRCRSEAAVQQVELTVGRGSIAEWIPEPTIPFAGSNFEQTIHVQLGPGATILLWDAYASGRMAREERWAFHKLQNEIRITTASGASMVERCHVTAEALRSSLVRDWNYVAALYLISDGVQGLEQIEERIAETVSSGEGTLGAVSRPAVSGLVVRLMARSAVDLNGLLESVWGVVREELWGYGVPALRRY
jgi:urease accessory protein